MKISSLVLGIIFIIGFGFVGIYFFGRHTEYCPWKHILLTTADCIVLDRNEDRVIIQHRDIDGIENENNYLEIVEAGQSQTYFTPEVLLNEKLKVELLPKQEEEIAILVDGQKQQLKSNNKIER